MAIYSLHHSSIGKATHRPGTASAHLRYIARESACSLLIGNAPSGVSVERLTLERWLREEEKSDRANARVIDKLTVALPIELDATHRAELVSTFCSKITDGKVPWVAGIHDRGEDAHNPHAHILIRDREFKTGARYIRTSSKGSTERFRLLWEQVANEELARCGEVTRIDRRSHRERGVPFAPTIHLGTADRLERKGIRTDKARLNRRIVSANEVLAEAIEIAQQAEGHAARLRGSRPNEIHDGSATQVCRDEDDWLLRRQRMLSEFYETAVGSDVARFWRIEHVSDGVRFSNKNGSFVDTGNSIVAAVGNDAEIAGMLEVARLKGWTTLTFSGSADFKRRAAAAALTAGFEISGGKVAPFDEAADLRERLRDRARRQGPPRV
ncbi:MAG: MobA/MobL family protein [Candidatus Velthaea sp.]